MPGFRSIRDEKNAVEHMFRKLDSVRGISDNKVNQHAAIDTATELLELRREVTDEHGDDSEEWEQDEIEDLLKHLRIAISGIDPESRFWVDRDVETEAPAEWSPSDAYQWREWDLERIQPLVDANGNPLGYSPNGELTASYVPPGGGATWHLYSEIPESITWELTPIDQKGIGFLIGKAKVCEIDAVSSVPSLPEAISSSETGERVLDRDLAQDEWQRRVDPKRILAIRDFIGLPDNIVANSALLYSPAGEGSITCTKEGIVEIDFGGFLKQMGDQFQDKWFDDDSDDVWDIDLRPMWLIDGQHRTRGLAQSEIGSEMEIPVILFTDEFSLNESAKVFAEINTLQRPLSPLHTLFMQHRFRIPTGGGKRDFRPWDVNENETWDSRQNNRVECAGWLASHEGGPLFNRIKILEANAPRFTIIKANSWVDYSRYWFRYPYGPDCPLTPEQMFQEVENYFQAFVNTCNHQEWPGEEPDPRWSPNSRNKGLLQMHSTSRALLDVYADVWETAAYGNDEEIIPISRFMEVLEPFYWVDWLDSRILERYHGSGEVPRTALRVWMREAIRNGEKFQYDDVMSDEQKSLPGRGILSPPEDSAVTVASEDGWPVEGRGGAVLLSSTQPLHSLATSRWIVTDSSGKEWGPPGGHKVQVSNGIATFKLKHDSWVDRADFIDVKAQWSNVNPPAAHGEIRLLRPDEA